MKRRRLHQEWPGSLSYCQHLLHHLKPRDFALSRIYVPAAGSVASPVHISFCLEGFHLTPGSTTEKWKAMTTDTDLLVACSGHRQGGEGREGGTDSDRKIVLNSGASAPFYRFKIESFTLFWNL